jgi:hypothetical protein
MQDKQKVTLYLPQELHRQLKIRAAVDLETMTEIAQKAIDFYLNHSEVVEHHEDSCGQSHRVYTCPDCSGSMVLKGGELASLRKRSAAQVIEELSVDAVIGAATVPSQGEDQLVPC